MNADGSLQLSLIPAYAQHLVKNDVRGVFVCGTSGEGQSLTLDERTAVAEAWAKDSNRSKLELFVHIGHNAQADAAKLAAHAHSIGADAVAMHAPSWFKGMTLASLIDFCVSVAAASNGLPFYLYDMPSVTGVQLSSAQFLKDAQSRIPNLAGLKYTNPDCITAQECIQADGGQFDVLWGTDEALLVGIALGASGAVGSTYNFAAPIYHRVIAACEAGDWPTARAEQAQSIAMIRTILKYGGLAALKFTTSLVGVDCGPTRPPVAPLTEEDKRKLRSELIEGGYLELPA